jgi:hypothetical protein
MTRLLGQVLLGSIIIIGGFALNSEVAANPLLAILLGSGLLGVVFAIGQHPDSDDPVSMNNLASLHF